MNKMFRLLFFSFVVLIGCTSKQETIQVTSSQNIAQPAYEQYKNTHTLIEETDNYVVYEQLFEKDNQKIYGQFVLPKKYEKPLFTVIIGHGFNSSYVSNMVYAKALANQGIAAYAFDFIGGATVSKSDGDMIDTSIISQRRDMEVILHEMHRFEFVDQNNVFLMGDSQGGLVAALTAGQYPDLVKGLILLYPAFRLPKMLQLFQDNLEQLPDTITIMGGTIGKRYVKDVANLNVDSEIAKFKGSVLIFQGDKDLVVSVNSSEEAVMVYDNATLEIIQGAGHGFDSEQTEIVIKKIFAYLNK